MVRVLYTGSGLQGGEAGRGGGSQVQARARVIDSEFPPGTLPPCRAVLAAVTVPRVRYSAISSQVQSLAPSPRPASPATQAAPWPRSARGTIAVMIIMFIPWKII